MPTSGLRKGIATAAIICAVLLSSGCMLQNQEGFAVYLTEGDIPPESMPALDQVDIAKLPIISVDDVVTYNAQTHELKLTTGAYEDLMNLDVPVNGRSFVVCVDREPIYWGAIWTLLSSISFDGVIIRKPSAEDTNVVALELGYPSSSFHQGEDPRNDSRIMESLERAGKLISNLSMEAVDELPHSMKGYELYSWLQDGEWHFTLITGTNRNKALEEVISTEDFISETGWVKIHVVGVDEIKVALSKLREGEDVLWLRALRGPETPGTVNITLPEGSIVDDVKHHATECGLNLAVQ